MSMYQICETAIFCESWCPSRGCFKSIVICHCNACFDQSYERLDEVMAKSERWNRVLGREGE